MCRLVPQINVDIGLNEMPTSYLTFDFRSAFRSKVFKQRPLSLQSIRTTLLCLIISNFCSWNSIIVSTRSNPISKKLNESSNAWSDLSDFNFCTVILEQLLGYKRRSSRLAFSFALPVSSKVPRLVAREHPNMTIQVLVFIVISIQVSFLTCVDLDQILNAVERDQEVAQPVSPIPGISV